MSLYQWLLGFHVGGGFLLLGGAICAGVLNVLAQRSKRPSEIALFFRLARIALALIGIGVLVTLVIGLWLVHEGNYSYTDFWVIASVVLWVVANALGGRGGRRDKETRLLAERLAAEGDAPSAELRARVRDRTSLLLSWGSGVVVLAILVLMIWKPGH